MMERLRRPGSRGKSREGRVVADADVIQGSPHADFVEMKVHGMEARISKRQMKDGTFIKEFLRKPNCSDRITMTRWSLKDFHIELIDEYINFQGIPFIIELSVDENYLTHRAASVLAENISDWKGALHNIELFNIRGNEIGDKGAKCLAQCFQTHTQIRVVDVSSNGIKATGAMYFAQCIARNKSITLLDLSKNIYGEEGRGLLVRGQEARKTRMSALQLVASGLKENVDTLEVVL